MRMRNEKHGLSYHPLYSRCLSAIKRCCDPNDEKYPNYGGRGITIHDAWKDNLELMILEIENLIGLPPTRKHQIDRINNELGYIPDNLRWSTVEENCRNKRVTHNQAKAPTNKKSTRTYNSWMSLVSNFKDQMCVEWIWDNDPETKNGFQKFYEDMGDKPLDRKEAPIKRHDDSKLFSKDNCYWGFGKF